MDQYPAVPGYGGGMFPINPLPPLPDYSAGIDQALAENAALGAQQQEAKPKFDFGKFLAAWAGTLGDNLTGNPVYANAIARMQQAESASRAEAERRQYEQAWWLAQQRYRDSQPPQPTQTDRYIDAVLDPGTDPQRRELLKNVLVPPQAPFMVPYGYEPTDPAPSGGGLREQAIDAIRQGADPTAVLKRLQELEGGQPAGPAGGFP